MDELLDILDSKGYFIGKTALKSVAHRDGLFHQTVHIWFYTADGQVLLQQRGKNKLTYPLFWDVSVAGHIVAGEQIETAALREIKEEIGLKITKDALEKVGTFKSEQLHTNGLKDYEFHHCFLCELKKNLKVLKRLKLVPLYSFFADCIQGSNTATHVPHSQKYFKAVLAAVSAKVMKL